MKNAVLAWLCLGALLAGVLHARSVELSDVQFSRQRIVGVTNSWWEAKIDLRSPQAAAVENVKVSLLISFERAGKDYYFSGEEKLLLLDRNASVRFYIPGDVVSAYQLPLRPQNYILEVSVAGQKQDLGARAISSLLQTSDKQKSFLVAAKSARKLLPHYKTPFYSMSTTLKDLPAYDIP